MPNEQTVLILGANGRFGRAAQRAFADAGWRVLAQARRPLVDAVDARVSHLQADIAQPAAVAAAALGADVVVNAMSPLYTRWEAEALELNEAAVRVAAELGATLMLPGNVYNYGRWMPPTIDADTPERPSTRKGEIRCRMEARMREGCARSIVIRAGDFFGGAGAGTWMDLMIARDLRSGRVVYPGPWDLPHAWAYVPDLARTFVLVAQRRDVLEPHAALLFPGHTLTGEQLIGAITQAAWRLGLLPEGVEPTVRRLPWGVIGVAGLLIPMLREIWRMRYLWRVPHALDGADLERLIGVIPSTPLADAMFATLSTLGAPESGPGGVAPR